MYNRIEYLSPLISILINDSNIWRWSASISICKWSETEFLQTEEGGKTGIAVEALRTVDSARGLRNRPPGIWLPRLNGPTVEICKWDLPNRSATQAIATQVKLERVIFPSTYLRVDNRFRKSNSWQLSSGADCLWCCGKAGQHGSLDCWHWKWLVKS